MQFQSRSIDNHNEIQRAQSEEQSIRQHQPDVPIIGDLNGTEGVALFPESTSSRERANELQGKIARDGSCRSWGGLQHTPRRRHLSEGGHCDFHFRRATKSERANKLLSLVQLLSPPSPSSASRLRLLLSKFRCRPVQPIPVDGCGCWLYCLDDIVFRSSCGLGWMWSIFCSLT